MMLSNAGSEQWGQWGQWGEGWVRPLTVALGVSIETQAAWSCLHPPSPTPGWHSL